MVQITNYSTVAAAANVYTIDFANSPVKNVKIETEDSNAKTVVLANVPTGDAELFIELTYTNAAAITWFAGITWLSGAAPTFETGKVYRIALFKYGTGWHGNCVGGVVIMTPAKRLIMMGFVRAKNELVYTPATWAEWSGIGTSGTSVVDNYLVAENKDAASTHFLGCNFKPNTKYGMLIHIRFNTRDANTIVSAISDDFPFENDFRIPPYGTGNFKHVSVTKAEFSRNSMYIWVSKNAGKIELGKYRVFELPAGSQIEWDFENLGADQLDAKYPF